MSDRTIEREWTTDKGLKVAIIDDSEGLSWAFLGSASVILLCRSSVNTP